MKYSTLFVLRSQDLLDFIPDIGPHERPTRFSKSRRFCIDGPTRTYEIEGRRFFNPFRLCKFVRTVNLVSDKFTTTIATFGLKRAQASVCG